LSTVMKAPIFGFVSRDTGLEHARWTIPAVSVMLVAGALLAGCAALPFSSPASSKSDETQQSRLLHYANRIDDFNQDQLHRQVEQARRQFSSKPTGYHRLKLALLLMKSGTADSDYSESEALLTTYVMQTPDGHGDQALVPLAQFLLVTVRTRQKLSHGLAEERDKRRKLQRKVKKVTAVVGGS